MNAELMATKQFDASIAELLTVDGVAALEYAIAMAPGANPVIPGTGGARKMRWARKGMGKRGGIRVIYYYGAEYNIVALIAAYAKNRQEHLTND